MARVPKVVSLQYRQNCRLPWADPAGGPPKLPRDTLVLTDQLNCKSPDLGHRRHCCGCETSNELTAPFAITRPRWLVRGRVPQRTPPWAHRKLLFWRTRADSVQRRLAVFAVEAAATRPTGDDPEPHDQLHDRAVRRLPPRTKAGGRLESN